MVKRKLVDKAAEPGEGLESLENVAMQEPNPNYKLEVRTVKTKMIKVLFEALKYTIFESNLIFSNTGLKVVTIDKERISLSHLQMDCNFFDMYKCEERMKLGVDMIKLYTIIKTMGVGDTLVFYIAKDNLDHLGVAFENMEKKSTVHYSIRLKTLAEERINDSIAFDGPPPEISSIDLKKVCSDLYQLDSKQVQITMGLDKLVFESTDGIAKYNHTMQIDSQGRGQVTTTKGRYLVKFLRDFSRSAHMAPRVKLFQQDQRLLIIEYAVANVVLRFCLSSMTVDD